jgi:hypothetical protein
MPNDLDILRREADRLRHVSETCIQQGDYSTAYQLLKMVVEIEERDVGVDKSALAGDYHTLGSICLSLNGIHEAQHYLQQALDLRLTSSSKNASETQRTADLLNQVMSKLGLPKPITGTGSGFEAPRQI